MIWAFVIWFSIGLFGSYYTIQEMNNYASLTRGNFLLMLILSCCGPLTLLWCIFAFAHNPPQWFESILDWLDKPLLKKKR